MAEDSPAIVVDRAPSTASSVILQALSIEGHVTPDQYWSSDCSSAAQPTIFPPCHARTTSRQDHDSLGDQSIFALRQPQQKIDLMWVRSSSKRAAIQNYEQNAQAEHEIQRMLITKALNSGLDDDLLAAVMQSGGSDRSTVALYPVKEVRGLAESTKYFENIYPVCYPMKQQKRRRAEAAPFIPDNFVSERQLLGYLRLPADGVIKLEVEDIFDFDDRYEDDATDEGGMKGLAMEGVREADGAEKSKVDTPTREASDVDSNGNDGEEKADVQMEG